MFSNENWVVGGTKCDGRPKVSPLLPSRQLTN